MKTLFDFEELDRISNTNERLLELPIGTCFTVKNDRYKDVYKVVEFPYREPQEVQKESWTLYYHTQHADPYFQKCTNCAFHWRVGFCSDIREPGPLFCEGPDHYGARKDGKRVYFIPVDIQ